MVWSLEALSKFEPGRKLENFLIRHCRFRALNAIRDKVTRRDAPCAECHAGTPCQPDGQVCPKFARWAERNKAKANLSRPVGIDYVADEGESRMGVESKVEDQAAANELSDLIDRDLPIDLREDYLKMLAGISCDNPHRRNAIKQAVADILRKAGVEVNGEPVDYETLMETSPRGRRPKNA